MSGFGASLRAAWAAAQKILGSDTAGSPTKACPYAPSVMPDGLPKDCCAAPSSIVLPATVNTAMQKGFKNSFPGGKSQEQGGIITKSADGIIDVVNESGGTSGTYSPNRTVPSGQRIIGIFHTHPYDVSEGGFQGVSFSAADISIAITRGEPDYVDAGSHQFAIVPTKATPAISSLQMKTEWEADFNARLAARTPFPEASRQTALALAKKYDMAYYEGSDGTLKKVSC